MIRVYQRVFFLDVSWFSGGTIKKRLFPMLESEPNFRGLRGEEKPSYSLIKLVGILSKLVSGDKPFS